MIRSMTGYGRGRASAGDAALVVEIRSVNARGLEPRVRLPQELWSLEPEIRARVREAVARGRVDVHVGWEGPPPTSPVHRLNPAGLDAALAALVEARRREGVRDEDVPPGQLLGLPGVLEPGEPPPVDLDALRGAVFAALDEALAAHRASREEEGARLLADLAARGKRIGELVAELPDLVDGHASRVAEALRERVAELMGDLPIDETRVAQEIALAAQRADVTEELVRLRAHLERLAGLLRPEAEGIGRPLEFLVQEIRREATTIASKTGDPEVDGRLLAIKAELEKIREQAANLE